MLELLVVASWLCFAVYSTWFFTRAKQHVTLNPGEVYVLWWTHKRAANCNALNYCYKLDDKKGIIGFKCFCGYEYESKRPIV
jgi:hypothetical protein